jgi:maltose-binding protein MalE
MSADETLAAVLADPSTGPDVFIGPHLWMTALTDAGIAEPLDRGSEVVAGALAAVTLRATVYAAPLGLDTVVQFRNTTGLAVAPASVESLSTGCPDGDGVGPCLLIPIESVDSHYPFLVALGGYVFGADEYEEWDVSDVGVDSDEAVAGVSILKLLADDDITLGDGNSSVVDRFVAGTAPLLWGTLDSKAALEAAGARFVVEQLPSIAEAAAISPVYVTAAWVNAFAPGKEAAARFVSGYLAAPEVGNAVALELGMAPVNIGYDDDAQLVPFIETARGGHPVPTVFQTPYAWEQLAVAFSQIRSGDDVSAALLEAAVAIRNAPTPEPPVEDEG